MKRFALRTIRDGRVKVGGVEYRLDEQWMAYDGRLDGRRFAFARYYDPNGNPHPFLSLWGSERSYWSDDPETDWPGAECVDGKFVWTWWYPVKSERAAS